MNRPIIGSGQLEPLMIQRYERYLPTAFDESMSLLQKVNKTIDYLNQIGEITDQVTEQWNQVMEWVMNDGFSPVVSQKLDVMAMDGSLAEIINEILFQELSQKINDVEGEVDALSESVGYTNQSIVWGTPEMYGAIGDGVADDTNALQTAFDRHRFVLIPDKEYKASKVQIKKPVTVVSNGGLLKPFSNTAVLQSNGVDEITIKGVMIDGTNGTDNCGIQIVEGKDILIDDVTLENMPVTALHLNYCERFEIKSCKLNHSGTEKRVNASGVNMGCAMVIQNSSYGSVHHNTILDTWQIPIFIWADDGATVGVNVHHNTIEEVYDNGIRFQPDPQRSNGINDWNAVRGCTASYNTIKNVKTDGIRLSGNNNSAIGNLIEDCSRAVNTQGGTDLSVLNNIVRDCAEGIRLFPDRVHLQRGTISGNSVYNTHGSARAIGAIGNNNPTIAGVRIIECVVTDNKVYDSAGYGIEVTDISGVTVSNNMVKDCAKSGIYLRDTNRANVSGNICRDNNNHGGPYSGIHTDQNVTQTIITNNTCNDTRDIQKQSQGIFLNTGGSYIIVKNNSCFDNAGTGIYDNTGNPTSNIIADNFTGRAV